MDFRKVDKANVMKEQLDAVSPTFCLIKWKHATINFASGAVKSCCHLPFRKVNPEALSNGYQLHDTDEDRSERRQMLQGQRPSSCNYCWAVEDKGQQSDRILWSSETFGAPFYDEVVKAATDQALAPSWVELNFSNVCNLKCSYCSPIFSTKWQAEVQEMGPYPTDPGHNDINYLQGVDFNMKYDSTELTEKFWPWFESAYPAMRLLKITGGEPFLSPQTMKVLEWIKDHPRARLSLSINSNLSVERGVWTKFIQIAQELKPGNHIARFYLHPSIDAFGKRAEYIRHGLDFELFQKNVEEYLSQVEGHVVFICTVNNLALAGLKDLWKYILSLKETFGKHGRWVSISTEVLIGPDWQSIRILPQHFKMYLEEVIAFAQENKGSDLTKFSDFEIMGLKKALAFFDNPSDSSRARANFYRFFKEHDRRRQTDFESTFPELVEFWQECRALCEPTMAPQSAGLEASAREV